jgi:hypothetical protein
LLQKSAPLDFAISIKASKLLCVVAGIAYLNAALSILLLAWQYPLAFALLLLLIPHAIATFRQECLRTTSNAIIHCQGVSSSIWRLQNRAGKTVLAKMVAKPIRTPWVIILRFKLLSTQRLRVLVVPRDGTSPQSYTQLLSRLWNCHSSR